MALQKFALQPGILSRSGWSLIEDSTPLIDGGTGDLDDGWIVSGARGGRAVGAADLYLFMCGTAYEECAGEFAILSGRMRV